MCHLSPTRLVVCSLGKEASIIIQMVGLGTSKTSFSVEVEKPGVVICADFHKQVNPILSNNLCQVRWA